MIPGLWVELMEADAVAAALPSLRRLGPTLGLALPSRELGNERWARLTRLAADEGIAVRAWPLLPVEHGYWPNRRNLQRYAELVQQVLAWRRDRGGPALSGVSFDLEPGWEYSEALRAAQKRDPARWLSLLRERRNPRSFGEARRALARLAGAVQSAGLVAHAVTYPLVLDQPEGSFALEDALDIPVSGLDWDEVSFMVYATAFAQQTGRWLGPSLVASYAASASERFGERAGLDLGVVGEPGLGLDAGHRYPSPEALAVDAAAALAEGIAPERLRVYGLAGVLEQGGPERWMAPLTELTPRRPAPSRSTDGLRATVRALATHL